MRKLPQFQLPHHLCTPLYFHSFVKLEKLFWMCSVHHGVTNFSPHHASIQQPTLDKINISDNFWSNKQIFILIFRMITFDSFFNCWAVRPMDVCVSGVAVFFATTVHRSQTLRDKFRKIQFHLQSSYRDYRHAQWFAVEFAIWFDINWNFSDLIWACSCAHKLSCIGMNRTAQINISPIHAAASIILRNGHTNALENRLSSSGERIPIDSMRTYASTHTHKHAKAQPQYIVYCISVCNLSPFDFDFNTNLFHSFDKFLHAAYISVSAVYRLTGNRVMLIETYHSKYVID